jgi:hypothetical protein
MTLDNFLPFILPEVQGCPEPLINQHLVQAAIAFCQGSKVWTEIKTPIALVDNQSDYPVTPPVDAYTHDFRDVWVGARRLTPKSMADIAQLLPNWQTATSNEPIYYNQASVRGSLTVYPKPTNTNGATLTVRAMYVPTAAATTLPDFLYERYLHAIAAGTKSTLMMLIGKAWANPAMASYYGTVFDTAIDDALISEVHDRVTGTVSVPYRAFGF